MVWVSAKISLGSFKSIIVISYFFLCNTDSNWFFKRIWPYFYFYNTGSWGLAVTEVNYVSGLRKMSLK